MKKDILFLILYFIVGCILFYFIVDVYNSESDLLFKDILFYIVTAIFCLFQWLHSFMSFCIRYKLFKRKD